MTNFNDSQKANRMSTIRSLRIILPAILLFISLVGNAKIPAKYRKYLTKTTTTNLYWKPDQNPEFVGGRKALLEFYNKKLIYPPSSQDNRVQGTVFVLFIIEADGSVTNVHATNKIDGLLESAAVRAVKKMPKWEPGIKDNKPVRTLMVLPLKFGLR